MDSRLRQLEREALFNPAAAQQLLRYRQRQVLGALQQVQKLAVMWLYPGYGYGTGDGNGNGNGYGYGNGRNKLIGGLL